MPKSVELSDVQQVNRARILAIRTAVKRDPVSACYQFCITPKRALWVGNLNDGGVQRLIASLSEQCAFRPAKILLEVFDAYRTNATLEPLLGFEGMSNVQQLDLAHLMIMKTAIMKDAVSGCYRFGINLERAQIIMKLSPEDVRGIMTGLGEQCAFRPTDVLWAMADCRPAVMPWPGVLTGGDLPYGV